MSQSLCFNASTSRVCVTFVPTNASQAFVTQGFFDDIGNAISSAYDEITNSSPSQIISDIGEGIERVSQAYDAYEIASEIGEGILESLL